MYVFSNSSIFTLFCVRQSEVEALVCEITLRGFDFAQPDNADEEL